MIITSHETIQKQDKQRQKVIDNLEQQIADFFAKGGKIQQIPTNNSTTKTPDKYLTKQHRK